MRRAFTLVELLVCVAVVALLIAVVLPAIAGSHLRARDVRCKSNIRGLLQAESVYAAARGGRHTMELSAWDIADCGTLVCPEDGSGGTSYDTYTLDGAAFGAVPVWTEAVLDTFNPALFPIVADGTWYWHGPRAGERRKWRNFGYLDGHVAPRS